MSEWQVLEFAGFTVDLRQRQLFAGDKPLPLTPKAFDTLAVLLESPGEVVAKDELLSRIWSDSYVEDGILSQNIYTLRKVLSHAGGGDRFIETIPRRGYRFVGKVEARSFPVERAVSAVASLAVLPFESWSSDPDDAYLGLGLADALITRISELNRLAVRPTRTVRSYLGVVRDPIAIGRALEVDAVLDGTIQRSGDHMRITVQLISVRDGVPLWATKLDAVATDLFGLEDSLSQKLATELRLRLTRQERDRLTRRAARDPEAYQACLRGRYLWNRRTGESLERAIASFRAALARDPDYAAAYAGLADCYVLLPLYAGVAPRQAFPEAIAAAESALALDASLAEAHTALAYARFFYDRDFAAAAEGFRRAIACQPDYPTAHQWHAFLLSARGRHEAALAAARHALALDPVSLVINADYGMVLYFAGRYEEALGQFERTLELDGSFAYAHFGLGHALEQLGRTADAVAALGRAVELAPESAAMQAALGYGLALSGETEAAWRILAELTLRAHREHVEAIHFAFLRIALGDRQGALDRLEEACEERSRFVLFLAIWPVFDPLRQERRFTALLEKAGLV